MAIAACPEFRASERTRARATAGWDSRGLRSSIEFRAQELCGSRGGRPGLPVPDILSVRSLWT